MCGVVVILIHATFCSVWLWPDVEAMWALRGTHLHGIATIRKGRYHFSQRADTIS